ncbi:MAG: hypothetical protein AAGA75_25790 [Cyanobacteria bacterium P01_E01_bin.6]
MKTFLPARCFECASLALGASLIIQVPAHANPSVTNKLLDLPTNGSEEVLTILDHKTDGATFSVQKEYIPPQEGTGSGTPDRTQGSGTR